MMADDIKKAGEQVGTWNSIGEYGQWAYNQGILVLLWFSCKLGSGAVRT